MGCLAFNSKQLNNAAQAGEGQRVQGNLTFSGKPKWNSVDNQSCTQNPQALWPAVGCQERLWGTGILLPQDFCGKTMEAITELIQSSLYQKKFFEFSRCPPADQKAWGLWVRDCETTNYVKCPPRETQDLLLVMSISSLMHTVPRIMSKSPPDSLGVQTLHPLPPN